MIEPETELVWNWHLDAICLHLQAVADGRIRRLVINVPPGHMKSILVGVMFPAWMWTHTPSWRVLCASYVGDLAVRDNMRSRRLVESDWYQRTFEPDWGFAKDENQKTQFENTVTGGRKALSVAGKTTGFRGNCLIIDDPHNINREVLPESDRNAATQWLDKGAMSRLNNKITDPVIMIMQRLHEEDLSGHVLKKGGWVHLMLPSRFEPDRKCVVEETGWEDQRTEEGEPLFPQRFPPDILDEIEHRELGSRGFAGQHQQRPNPEGGQVWLTKWWRYYDPKHPPWLDEPESWQWIQSWDCAFKDNKSSSYVCGGLFAKRGAEIYLVDLVRERLSFTATLERIKGLRSDLMWRRATTLLIEDKANGTAVIDTLRRVIPGIIPVNPGRASKYERAVAVSPMIEAGNVHLPREVLWALAFIVEAERFPNGTHNDQVDMMSQALHRFQQAVEILVWS